MLLFYVFPLKDSLPEGGEGSLSALGTVIIWGMIRIHMISYNLLYSS